MIHSNGPLPPPIHNKMLVPDTLDLFHLFPIQQASLLYTRPLPKPLPIPLVPLSLHTLPVAELLVKKARAFVTAPAKSVVKPEELIPEIQLENVALFRSQASVSP